MRLLDSRRLTGPNVQTSEPAALLEVAFESEEDPDAAIAAWRSELARVFGESAMSLTASSGGLTTVRRFHGGAALCLVVPIDELLWATDVNEWALERATAVIAGKEPAAVEPRLSELLAARALAHRPLLLALAAEAERRALPFVWDDTEVTVGAGRGARTYPIDALPAIADVPWSALGSIPIALITGTNGKTTSARLVARILRLAGRAPGLCTTDGVSVDEAIVERGDWTGPAAARAVLRRADVEVAILETARGGILRRGLALAHCDAALITNVSADHLGDYGIDDVRAMADVKAVVGHAVRPGGALVLGADDPTLRALAPRFGARLVWFTLDAHHPLLAPHRAAGGEAWFLRGQELVHARGDAEQILLTVDELPIAFGGAAPYNVLNALGAAALAAALGSSDAEVVAGLRSFGAGGASGDDNPGRGNFVESGGVQILLDFGHNPAGVRAVMSLVRARRRPGDRVTAILSQPGDRSDEALGEVARALVEGAPDRVILHDMLTHLRGRSPGEVPAILERALAACGLASAAVTSATDEVEALAAALDGSRPGDLVVVLPHLDREGVQALLALRSGR